VVPRKRGRPREETQYCGRNSKARPSSVGWVDRINRRQGSKAHRLVGKRRELGPSTAENVGVDGPYRDQTAREGQARQRYVGQCDARVRPLFMEDVFGYTSGIEIEIPYHK